MLFPSLPEVIENHIMEYSSDYHDKYKRVLQDILKATTCHGCGVKSQVALIGYSNRFCNKSCWRGWEDSRYTDIDDGTTEDYTPPLVDEKKALCYFGSYDCECYGFTLAVTTYFNRIFDNSQSPSGVCWPMGNYTRVCNNECVRNRPIIEVGRDFDYTY